MIPKSTTLQEIEVAIRRSDKTLRKQSRSWDAAVVLMASLHLGAHVLRLSEFTGIPLQRIRDFEANLRRARIWTVEDTVHEISAKVWIESDSDYAFWLDASVAEGLIDAFIEEGEFRYRLSTAGTRRVEKLLKRALKSDSPDHPDGERPE